LRAQGSVIPVTNEKVHLEATYGDGVVVTGEHAIDEPSPDRLPHRITHLAVTPQATISEVAEAAILNADLIVLGPGDVYTSVLANCVIDGVAEAIQNAPAHVVYICNLMTKTGQTMGMGVREHVAEITKYTGRTPDTVLVNDGVFPAELLEKYALDNEFPVALNHTVGDYEVLIDNLLATEAVQTIRGDVLKRSLIRHDSRKLARRLIGLLRTERV
jgi:uncharacterized cofD-like protein